MVLMLPKDPSLCVQDDCRNPRMTASTLCATCAAQKRRVYYNSRLKTVDELGELPNRESMKKNRGDEK